MMSLATLLLAPKDPSITPPTLPGKTPPGVEGPLNHLYGWITGILGWMGGIGFVVVGILFCYAYLADTPFSSEQTFRALAAVMTGCIIIGAAGGIANLLLT